MKRFHLTILGCSAAMPAYGRFPSSQVLNYNDNLFLIDAGEGTQIRLGQYKIKRNNVRAVFISHLHGDHVFGLPGFLTSLNHFSRKTELKIFGPQGLKKFLDAAFDMGGFEPRYPISIVELEESKDEQVVWESHELQVKAFPLKHRITTFGYRFDEKQPKPNIRKAAIEQYQLTVEEIIAAKNGGTLFRNDQALTDVIIKQDELRSYVYCSDTMYDPSLLPFLNKATVLYCETTYTQDLEQQARERGHCTGKDAAKLASAADVKTLVTGHYSGRYKLGDEPFLEAQSLFENTYKGYDGFMHEIK